MSETRSGSCLCGAVRFRLTGKLRDVSHCHCAMCRRWHGHVGAYTNVARSGLEFTEARGLKWFRSSAIARRGFCGECGSSLFWDGDKRDAISVAAGALDAPTGLVSNVQIFTEDKGDYYELDPRVPIRPKTS